MNKEIIIFIIALVVVFLLFSQNKKESFVDKDKLFNDIRNSGYWVEISGEQFEPIFQGWLYTVTNDSYGIALGVLLEKDRNPVLLKDLKKARKVDYLGEGKILAKVIIDFESHVIMTDLKDVNLQASLVSVIESKKEIDVMLEISSTEIIFADNDEGIQSFSKIWNQTQPSRVEPRINNL
ncbi:MAG: hypothetical protein L3J59_12185 [Methylococcaceae bacterium]|nr:hypothetical protein [Methylococcaceae bacterium]